MSFDVDSLEVPLECPECKGEIKITLGQIKREETILCPYCGTQINLKDKDKSAKKGIEEVQQALDDLERKLKDIGAKF